MLGVGFRFDSTVIQQEHQAGNTVTVAIIQEDKENEVCKEMSDSYHEDHMGDSMGGEFPPLILYPLH